MAKEETNNKYRRVLILWVDGLYHNVKMLKLDAARLDFELGKKCALARMDLIEHFIALLYDYMDIVKGENIIPEVEYDNIRNMSQDASIIRNCISHTTRIDGPIKDRIDNLSNKLLKIQQSIN